MEMKGEVELLQRLESEVMEIKKMLERLEVMLVGEEEITEEERKEIEARLKESEEGETISLEEFLRDIDVQGRDTS